MPLYPRRFLLVTAFALSAFAHLCPAQMTKDDLEAYLRTLPPGTPFTIEQTVDDKRATGQGAGAEAHGDKLSQNVDSSAPAVTLPGVSSTGGSLSAQTIAAVFNNFWLRLIVGLIGAAIAGLGVWGIYRSQPLKSTTGLIATGLLLAASAVFIDIALLLLLGMALYNAASLYLTGQSAVKIEEQALRFKEALRAVAAGIADKGTPDLLAAIGSHADDADKAVIKQIKREDGL